VVTRNTVCVFCAIVEGRAPAEVVYQDDATMAFMDINPATTGHVLVIPRRHIRDLLEIDEDSAAAVMRSVVRVARAMREAVQPDGLNLVQASGRAAFQSVFHFHMHVIPRWRDDGLKPPWRSIPGDTGAIRATASRIRDHFEEY